MTDRMLGAIEQSLRNTRIRGIRWEAKTLTDRGRGTQEKEFGADFMGVLSISLPDFSVSKGFLAQAKIARRLSEDIRTLKEQCEKMLAVSPASFVFVYSDEGVRVTPAISVVASNGDPSQLYDRSAQRFFEEHLECFIGDRRMDWPTPETLTALREQRIARSALLIRATAE
jgi:hypothetical protein